MSLHRFAYREALLALVFAVAVHGQTRVNETAMLANDQNVAVMILVPPDNAPKNAKATAGPITDMAGKVVSPQPQVAIEPAADGTLKVTLLNVFFWGEARLPISFASTAPPAIYKLERGVTIPSARVDIPRNQPGEIWLDNPGTQAVEVRWRVLSGSDTLCGLDDTGGLRKDCNDTTKLPVVTIPPAGSAPVHVYVPTWWRNPWQVFGGVDTRQARLELRFGRSADAEPFDADVTLDVHSNFFDAVSAWVPPLVSNLFYVLFWITVGANLLMVAQVMIPNFRRSLQIEGKIDELKERLRAINSGVGSRLYTRCQQEITRVTEGLGIRDPDGRLFTMAHLWKIPVPLPKFSSWISALSVSFNRLALSGNTAEIIRLEGMMPRLESRLALTERFSDALTVFLSSDTLAAAPTSVFEREEKLRNLREILSRQLLTDTEEATARALLQPLEEGCAPAADFAVDLNNRLGALRRQLASPVFQAGAAKYIAKINGCAEVLAEKPDAAPPGGWTVDELIYRDLMAVKLRMIVFAIEIECLLAKRPDLDAWIQEKLQSSDPIVLARIYGELKQISEGISEDEIRNALKEELWDTLFEPPSVRTQDVLQFSFSFREKALNRSSARDTFQCYWKITPDDEDDAVSWEEGWTMQHIPLRRRFSVEPDIYDSAGNQVVIKKAPLSEKGRARIRVARVTGVSKRAIRGIIDAVITALVPVITVAVTQVQNGGSISVDKLILLGFTSQAIRAAIIPESVRPETAPKTTLTDGQTPPKPSAPPAQPVITPPPVEPDPKSKGLATGADAVRDRVTASGGAGEAGGETTQA